MRKVKKVVPLLILHPDPDATMRDLVRSAITLGLSVHVQLAPKPKKISKSKPKKRGTNVKG